MVTVHVWDAPLHAPPQPAKVDPAVGDADSETGVPEGYASEQSEPQLIPGGLAKPRAKLSKGQDVNRAVADPGPLPSGHDPSAPQHLAGRMGSGRRLLERGRQNRRILRHRGRSPRVPDIPRRRFAALLRPRFSGHGNACRSSESRRRAQPRRQPVRCRGRNRRRRTGWLQQTQTQDRAHRRRRHNVPRPRPESAMVSGWRPDRRGNTGS
jgi:hypothetical protein